ncbi:TPA: hypothetical protein ACONMS_000774, partial [Staphylococcus aureus]
MKPNDDCQTHGNLQKIENNNAPYTNLARGLNHYTPYFSVVSATKDSMAFLALRFSFNGKS